MQYYFKHVLFQVTFFIYIHTNRKISKACINATEKRNISYFHYANVKSFSKREKFI